MDSLSNFLTHSAKFPPFANLWLVKQFLCICRQTADGIGLKFCKWTYHATPALSLLNPMHLQTNHWSYSAKIRQTNSLPDSQAWLLFGNAPLNFCHLSVSYFASSLRILIDKRWSHCTQILSMNSLLELAGFINICQHSAGYQMTFYRLR